MQWASSLYSKALVCTSLQILKKYIYPHDIREEQRHGVPHKVWRDLFLKALHGRWGTIYGQDEGGGGGSGVVLHGELMIKLCQGWGSLTNTFFSNNSHFSNHEGIYT